MNRATVKIRVRTSFQSHSGRRRKDIRSVRINNPEQTCDLVSRTKNNNPKNLNQQMVNFHIFKAIHIIVQGIHNHQVNETLNHNLRARVWLNRVLQKVPQTPRQKQHKVDARMKKEATRKTQSEQTQSQIYPKPPQNLNTPEDRKM